MNRFWKNFKTVDFKPKNVPFILGKTRIFKKRPLTLSNPNYMQRIKKKAMSQPKNEVLQTAGWTGGLSWLMGPSSRAGRPRKKN